MDPLTIVTAAASLAGAVLKASFKIKETVDAYDDAPQNVADIAEEVHAVQIALRQVESVVLQDPQAIERLNLEDVFAVAVNGCHATLLSISKEYEDLFLRSDWRAKIKVLWKDGEMTRLLGRLDRKKATLTLLTQTLNLRSTQDIKALLVQNQSTLNAAKQDLKEPASYYADFRPTSPSSLDNCNEARTPRVRDSVLSTTEFDFDYDLINTKTYRRALQRYAAASQGVDPSPGQETESLPEFPLPLDPLLEEEDGTGDRAGSPSESLTFQSRLSRATTLQPGSEGVAFANPPATPPKEPTVRTVRSEVNEPRADQPATTLEIHDAARKKQLSRKKPETRAPRHLTAGLTAERHRRRKKHEQPALPEASSSPQMSEDALWHRDGAESASSCPATADTTPGMTFATQVRDKSEKRRKCGRPVHHRRRHEREALHTRSSETSSAALGSVDSVTDALEQLGLPKSRAFGRERGRRKQTV
ncbi:hypothetical protein CH063_09020 [Colletotrichum higginsianum]|uniref:Azaphilone pigments biosynthesis cluster protein L N-terminal domain-containing protein n=2 Tax=Colletotrichum higginsianum TaxID=80884 RepID=H1VC16_COLHI|nr:hypothetical protein CH63R_05044 [Colletotrichum higginsianum IMI 349063]OBR12748.1 hypothetical protein CH63R_05044 [Colletotrichum higginsianum IMI 349063]TIC99418.1 hypothetical protein CH35J_005167 [Colletotrichum higginsianum]CCF37769.1 hypothetical protein CH063_09020 [Colletotrichum higginsianum]